MLLYYSPATKNPSTVKTLDIENKFLYIKKLSYEAEENTHSKKVLSRIEFIFLVFIKESYKNIEDYLESNSIQLSDLSLNLSNSLLEKNLDLITLKLRRINPKVIRAKTKKTVQYVQHYFLTPAFFINQTQLGT